MNSLDDDKMKVQSMEMVKKKNKFLVLLTFLSIFALLSQSLPCLSIFALFINLCPAKSV
jgi:hypothetical protein